MEFTQEQKLLQKIVHEAWENETFKQELINSPVKAIEKFTGKKLNLGGKTLVVKDQTDESVVYINIPTEQKIDDVELNEEQLEVVAGGGTIILPWITIPTLPTQGGDRSI